MKVMGQVFLLQMEKVVQKLHEIADQYKFVLCFFFFGNNSIVVASQSINICSVAVEGNMDMPLHVPFFICITANSFHLTSLIFLKNPQCHRENITAETNHNIDYIRCKYSFIKVFLDLMDKLLWSCSCMECHVELCIANNFTYDL